MFVHGAALFYVYWRELHIYPESVLGCNLNGSRRIIFLSDYFLKN